MDRRTFIKGAAALPIVVALPALAMPAKSGMVMITESAKRNNVLGKMLELAQPSYFVVSGEDERGNLVWERLLSDGETPVITMRKYRRGMPSSIKVVGEDVSRGNVEVK